MQQEEMMPTDDMQTQEDETEGSGNDPQMEAPMREEPSLISRSSYFGAGVCDPHHCGNTFCPGQQRRNCHVETAITPFAVSVHFGPPTVKRSPEENIGMCLRYTQLPCDT
ncbi:hypothetical protein HF086_011886 [Spodoptera exigua]|uniref:CUB domain-containing protein n=1 Tax=Spodoptera exigua TaxID=7107 RepID=A0A922SCF8_SPOEX|nr:hypothetical protein HF086_011886 [Spodoptera exigua]